MALPKESKGVLVTCQTTKGEIRIEIFKQWAPFGAERFLSLIKKGHYDGTPLYRCVPHFLVQFGIPAGHAHHGDVKPIPDDRSQNIPFTDGVISFAGNGLDSRTSEVFFSLGNQANLGKQSWETPFGKILDPNSLSVLHNWNTEYGDIAPFNPGKGIDPALVREHGHAYLKANFPRLDYIHRCEIVKDLGVKNHAHLMRVPVNAGIDIYPRVLDTHFGEIMIQAGEQKKCALHQGVDYFGNDIRGWTPVPTKTAEDCCELCLTLNKCAAFGWNDGSTKPSLPYKNLCFLKNKVGPGLANSAVTSGINCRFLDNNFSLQENAAVSIPDKVFASCRRSMPLSNNAMEETGTALFGGLLCFFFVCITGVCLSAAGRVEQLYGSKIYPRTRGHSKKKDKKKYSV